MTHVGNPPVHWLPCRNSGELVAITFVHVAPSCVDAATETELLNHRRLESPHVVRLQEVSTTHMRWSAYYSALPSSRLYPSDLVDQNLLFTDTL